MELLENLNRSYIGFGGGIPFLCLFIYMNLRYLSMSTLLFISIFIYGLSLGIGIAIDGFLSDFQSALTAGIYAPILFSFITTLFIRRNFKPINNKYNDILDSNM